MPLPSFGDFGQVWVEKTKASHGHGGAGWDFGTCLWSPSANKSGHRIYKNMVDANDGDLVLHFYEDTYFGNLFDYYFCGMSLVDGSLEVRKEPPPQAGEWAGRSEYFRRYLRSFAPFVNPIPIENFIKSYETKLLGVLKSASDLPFIIYEGGVRLAQGKYLSKCNSELYELLSTVVAEPIEFGKSPAKSNKNLKQKGVPFDYEDHVEGQRQRREIAFFARNPRLARDAKLKYDYQCQTCGFRYPDRYPEIGQGYIEAHHLDPLSERENADKAGLTNLSRVTVMRANCHRMIHRVIRKLGRAVSVDEFKTWIAAKPA